MSAVNSGAYLCPGADVTVVARNGDWSGRILSIGSGPGAEATVVVLDPGDNPYRWQGQRIQCHWRELRVPPPRRWER